MMPVKPNKIHISVEELQEILDYCPETGLFTWKVKTGPRAVLGKEAGGPHNSGYRQIMIKGVKYLSHRLAWYYIYGVEPREYLDHKNGVRDDNRLSNLREATWAENQRNQGKRSGNKSGYKGVFWNKETKKFRTQCKVNGKKHHLGYHDTAERAHAAYVAFATKEHGAFANTN
jgi:hypothetical protein